MTRRRLRALLVSLAVLWPSLALAATLTVMPTPFQTVLDGNGNPINGGKVCTYAAGTTTPIATYTDVTGATPNLNPIIADPAGRFTAWLLPGTSYKFIYQDASGTANTCDGVTFRTVDNVSAIPGSSAGVDISPAVAGEAITAGQAVYLSDGSGGKVAGQWYKADSANTYSSSAAIVVGIAPSSITSGGSGAIRLVGQVTGLSSLIVGSTYYIGTAGALTATAPANTRALGMADTTSTFVLQGNPGLPNADNSINDFRLTLTTALPVTTADVTGASAVTIFCTPSGRGNRLALYSTAGASTVLTSAEFSIAVPATTATAYDVFAYNNSGVATLELLAWTNLTTRATALVLTTTGTYTKSGDLSRRYLGSFRTTAVSGQTEDSAAKRYLWNYYNRAPRALQKLSVDATWNYTTATVRQANASTANQVEVFVGIADTPIELFLAAFVNNANNVAVHVGIGEDSTSTISTSSVGGGGVTGTGSVFPGQNLTARFVKYPAVGSHIYSWNEWSAVGGVSAWYGTPASASGLAGSANGISGSIQGP